MKLIRIDALQTQPWKNGGGVTREIALCSDEGRLVWRLSVADVERDGPFSLFPGLTRILTVIEGGGLRLRSAGGVIEARHGVPVSFSGDIPIDCELVSGPVRDFNLIFDPERVAMSVAALGAGAHRVTGEAICLLPLGATCNVDGFGAVPPGSFLLFDKNEEPDISVADAALLVTIDHCPDNNEATALR